MGKTNGSAGWPTFILVMGVSGAGKSTVAHALADQIDAGFVEADDHHSPDSLASLAAGHGLTDAMRLPWLTAVARAAVARHTDGRPVVIACSALKRRYRDLLRAELGPLAVIHLAGDPATIQSRLDDRREHFMSPRLLDSQFADLELPDPEEAAITLDVTGEVEAVIHEACMRLASRPGVSQTGTERT